MVETLKHRGIGMEQPSLKLKKKLEEQLKKKKSGKKKDR